MFLCIDNSILCVCVCQYDSQRCKLCVWFVYVCVISETVVHPLVKERDRQQLWRLYLVTEAEPLTRPQRRREREDMHVYFWGWDGLTGSCEKKNDCLSEADCRCRWGETAPSRRRCFISQQSVMQVEQTRWPGKDLHNAGPCSRMIVLCVCVYPVDARRVTHA